VRGSSESIGRRDLRGGMKRGGEGEGERREARGMNPPGREGGPIVSGPLRLSPPLVPRRVFAGLTAIRISFAEFIFITNKLFSPPSGFEPAGTCRPVTSPCIIRLIGERAGEKALPRPARVRSPVDRARVRF